MKLAMWLKRRWVILFRRGAVEADLSDEIRLHLDMEAEDLVRQGWSPAAARREARLRLGGFEQTKEAVRDTRPLHWLAGIGLDVRLGLRMLGKSWGLTLIGGLAMAVAVGVGTTVYAVMDAYADNTLPFDGGDRVVRLVTLGPRGGETTREDLEWWRAELRSVQDVGAVRMVERLLVTGDGGDARVSVAQMTAAGFRVAPVRPFLGRTLLEEDARAGGTPVAVISHDTWQRRLGGNRAAIGQTIQLGGVDHVVVGVMPSGFGFPLNHHVWTPLMFDRPGGAPANTYVVVFGKLPPGGSIEQAQAEMEAKGPARRDSPAGEALRARVVWYAQSFTQVPSWWMSVLPSVLALLLIPPCSNIAILIYARNVSRQGEFAARYVLGAGRGRIVGQLLVEAFVLTATAAALGLILAYQFLAKVQPSIGLDPEFPFWVKPMISMETVLYVAALAAFAAMIAGVVPALRATGRMRQSAFQGLGVRTSPRLGITWIALVVTQVAVTTAVLPKFGELIWTFLNPYVIGRDFSAEQFVTAKIVVEGEQPSSTPAQLAQRVQSEMGIAGVTLSASIDGIDETLSTVAIEIPGLAAIDVGINRIDGAYFNIFEASLLSGRAFEPADFEPGRRVAIVDRMFADELAGENPLGKRLRDTGSDAEPAAWYEIVGIVEKISPSGQRPFVYFPIVPSETRRMSLTLRTGVPVPSGFARELLAVTTALDPRLQVEQLRTLDAVYGDERREENLFGLVFSSVLSIVVLFSAAGIHTLVAFAVAHRRQEIGIRSALGAAPFRLVADVFRRDLFPVGIGSLVGACMAVPLDRLTRSDGLSVPSVFIFGAFLFMLTVGLIAIGGPARRALRINSVEALREN